MKAVSKLIIFVLLLSVLNTVSATPSVVKIDSDKVLNISGNRTFPVYMYSLAARDNDTVNGERDEPVNASLMKGRNFTFNAPYINPGASGSNYPYWHYTIPAFEYNNLAKWCADAQLGPNRPYMTTDGGRNMSTFFCYYQADEPEYGGTRPTLSELLTDYNNIKSVDPNHIVIQSTGGTNSNLGIYNLRNFESSSDVIQIDVYSHMPEAYLNASGIRKWWNTNGSVAAFERWVWQNPMGTDASLTDINQVADPVWAAIQANAIVTEQRELMTEELIRATAYTAITMDVKGIGFFSYKGNYRLFENQTLFNYTNNLAGEIRSFNDWLIIPTNSFRWYKHNDTTNVTFSNSYTISMPIYNINMPNFNYILKHQPGNNTWYLIVVNKGNTTVNNVGITISALTVAGSYNARMLGYEYSGSASEHKTIALSVANGVFTDSFDPYAVHIYELYKITSTSSAPIIESWSNSKNNDNANEVNINTSKSITFNATANQTITTWNWYNNGQVAGNNTRMYEASFSSGGINTISVSGTNNNGTTNTITWTVYVNQTSNTYAKIGYGGVAFSSANSAFEHTVVNKGDGKVTVGLFADNCDDGTSDWTDGWTCTDQSLRPAAGTGWSKQSLDHSDIDYYVKFKEINFRTIDLGVRADTSRNSTSMQYYLSARNDGTNISLIKYNGSWNSNQTLFSRSLNNWTYAVFKVYGNTQEGYMSLTSFDNAISSAAKSSTSYTDYATGDYIRLTGGISNLTKFDDIRVIEHNRYSGSIKSHYDVSANNQSNGIIINATTPKNTNYTVSYRQKNVSSWIPIGGVYTGNQTIPINGTKYQDTEINITLFGNGSSFPEIETIEFTREQVSDSIVFPRYDVNENSTVDMNDLTLVGQYFNEVVPFPYPRHDVNMDGQVNIYDISIVGQHFGEHF